MSGPMLPTQMLTGWARRAPHDTAVVEDDRSLTWAELDRRVTALATGMAEHGVRPGDAVAILATDRLEVFVHFLACLRLGAVRVGVNSRFASREVLHVLRDSDARMVVVETGVAGLLGGAEDALLAEGRTLVALHVDGGSVADRRGSGFDLAFDDLLSDAATDLARPGQHDVALISYTSGTTGLPKGVLVTQAAVAAALVHTVIMTGLGSDDVWYQATSLAWIATLLALLGLVNGMTVVLPGGAGTFDAEHFLRTTERRGVTGTVLAPVMIRRVLDLLENGEYDMSSFRRLVYGSSPAPPALLRRAHATLPGVELLQIYGITECSGGWVTVLTHADHLRGLSDEPDLLSSCGPRGPGRPARNRGVRCRGPRAGSHARSAPRSRRSRSAPCARTPHSAAYEPCLVRRFSRPCRRTPRSTSRDRLKIHS